MSNVIKRIQINAGANMPKAENPKKHRGEEISGVMKDFLESRYCISGYGIFEGLAEATLYAEKISENQLRQLTRYGLVPAVFIDFLESIGVKIDRKKFTRKQMTEGCLAGMLMTGKYDCRTEQTRSTAEYIGKMILLTQIPYLARSLRVTQDMERALSLYARKQEVMPLKT
jgi:hypothetical protein